MNLLAYIPGTQAWRLRHNAELCRKTTHRIQEIVDGEIGGTRAARILERHAHACRSCNAEAEVIRELKDAIARVDRQADAELVARLEALARDLCEGRRPEAE